jgi:hypothetical protein
MAAKIVCSGGQWLMVIVNAYTVMRALSGAGSLQNRFNVHMVGHGVDAGHQALTAYDVCSKQMQWQQQ